MLIREALRQGRRDQLDQELLLEYILKRDRAWLIAHGEATLTATQAQAFQNGLARLRRHEPLAYIVGEKEFYGRTFHVNQDTLIPRPETEILIELILKEISNLESRISEKNKKIAIIDVGTGSGNIIITLAQELSTQRFKMQDSRFKFFAIDISIGALKVADTNARCHEVAKRILFVKSDLLTQIKERLMDFDEIFVAANLPYLSYQLYREAEPNVRDFEPKTALVSGQDGLEHYRRLLRELRLIGQGKKIDFFLEISPEQALILPTLIAENSITSHTILPDLAGKPRVLHGCLK